MHRPVMTIIAVTLTLLQAKPCYCAGDDADCSGISVIMLEHTTPGKRRQRQRKRRNKDPTKGAGRDKDKQNALKEYKLQVRYQAMMKCSSKNCGGNDWMDVSKALRVILAIRSYFLPYVGVCSIFSRTVPESKLFNIFALDTSSEAPFVGA